MESFAEFWGVLMCWTILPIFVARTGTPRTHWPGRAKSQPEIHRASGGGGAVEKLSFRSTKSSDMLD